MQKLIDPHLHLFNLEQGQYHWLDPKNPPSWPDKGLLRKTASDQCLTMPEGLELAGYVHIEAGFDNSASWREMDWIEQQARLPFRCIAYLDLSSDPHQFRTQLDLCLKRQSFIGVRHILDDHLAELSDHPNTQTNLAELARLNLIFELQFDTNKSADVETICTWMSRYEGLTWVLNHGGFPPLEGSQTQTRVWHEGLERLADQPRLYVKCSGFEMTHRAFSFSEAAQTVASVVDAFGSERVMLASNYPLIELTLPYRQYWSEITEAVDRLNLPLDQLLYSNALQVYRF